MTDGSLLDETRPLAPAEAPALEALLAGQEPAATYARSHLRGLGLGPGGVRPGAGRGRGRSRRRWWPARALAGSYGATLPRRLPWRRGCKRSPVHLLSGPAGQVAPLLAGVPRYRLDGQDRCPFELLTPATFQPAPGPARRGHPRRYGAAD